MLVDIYSTIVKPTSFDFCHTVNAHHDQNNPKWSNQLAGFLQYFTNKNKKNSNTQSQIIQHMLRAKHHYSLTLEEANLYAFAKWGWNNNSIVVMTPNIICDPSGFILLNLDDSAQDENAQLPYTQDAIDRRTKTIKYLEQHKVSNLSHYSPIIGEKEVQPQKAQEAAKRAMALFVVALRAEIANKEKGYLENNIKPSPEVKLKQSELKEELSIDGLQTEWAVTLESLTYEEKEFLTAIDSPIDQQLNKFTWRYESLNVLLWSLNLIENLPYPSRQCNYVPNLVKSMLAINEKSFINQSNLRSTSDLLDMLDLHYILYNIIADNEFNGIQELNGVDSSVVKERYYALSWLLQFQNNNIKWDNITFFA